MATRRDFLKGAMAASGLVSMDAFGLCPAETPRMVFGVMSDVHIGGKPDAVERVEKALGWFASRNVDAVLCPGDIAHSGLIGELEAFAAAWNRVFPEGRAPDGRKVELMISTGNHDVDAWSGRWDSFSEADMHAGRFNYADNPEKTWRRLFNQKWELIWRREVKGYTFIGSQWSSLKPPVGDYFKAIAEDVAKRVPPDKPFFYCQHAHPKGTCHGAYSNGDDEGESVRALAAFPNAVAFSGHSHCAISDERTVWQGAFTSIGAGCLHSGAGGFDYDNVTAYWHSSYKEKLMRSMADPLQCGGDAKGGGCELVEVFDNRLVIHRQSVDFGIPIGPAWVVPVPARKGGPFDFSFRAAHRAAPQFADDARLVAKYCPEGHVLEGIGHRNEPCVYVTFPRAKTVEGCRVFDYVVEVQAEGLPPARRKLIAAGFAYPEEYADVPGECLFFASEIPKGSSVRLTVTPYECFGKAGRSLVAVTQL